MPREHSNPARELLRFARLVDHPGIRQAVVLGLDGALAATSLWLAMLLRFEGNIVDPYRTTLPAFVALLVGCRILASFVCRLHQWSFRFSGLTDAARVGIAGFIGTALFVCTIFLVRHPGPPRSVVVLELLLSWLMMAAVRFSPRLAGMYVRDWVRNRREGAVPTVIIGAGSAGEMLLRDLRRSQDHSYQIVGFVDDDRGLWNQIVGGKTVLGGIDDLRRLVLEHRVEQVLIAILRLPPRRIREILSLCGDLKLRFKILPVSYLYLQERAASSMIQDLAPEDLLSREPVRFSDQPAGTPLTQRTALVTGAAGSIGSEICEQLLRAGLGKLTLVDLNENALYLLRRRFERRYPQADISIDIADIRDRRRIERLFERDRPADVFHAAAHKHVPLLEDAPCEAVKNNILGTRNVVAAAAASGVERFVYISTDKAVRPTSVMGATKRVGEEIVREMARRSRSRFCAVRFGNVLGSAGSVLPIFQQQIAEGGPISVTHPDVSRYFMTISEAVSLVLQAAYGDHGELYVLDMGEPIKIVELARHMITLAGRVPDVDIAIEFTGLRPGEKLSEELLTEQEEQRRGVNPKIFVVDGPPPPRNLERWLEDLAQAADDQRARSVVELLARLVPSYTPSERAAAAEPAPLRAVLR